MTPAGFTPEELSYLRDGYPPRLLRQLKRGQFSVQDDIDLHQMNAAAAQASIVMFLAEASKPDLMVKAFDIDYSWPLHSTRSSGRSESRSCSTPTAPTPPLWRRCRRSSAPWEM